MKKLLLILIFTFSGGLVFGQLTLEVKADRAIDSIFFSNITQDKEYQFVRYSPSQLRESKADSAVINTLKELSQNISNVFSIEIAQSFMFRNMQQKPELKKAYLLLSRQDDAIRNRRLNPYSKIESILTRTKIDLSKFRFYTPDGKLEALTLSPGKKYLIDMWFVGCAPCIEQHKEMVNALTSLHKNNIDVIGISVDQNHTPWKNFLAAKKYSWLNVRETDAYEKRLRTDMLIDSYPTYFLINSDGNILFRASSFAEILKHVKI